MSEVTNNNYNQFFKVGMSKDDFITQYKTLATENKQDEHSVFLHNMTEETIGKLFDTIHISHNGDNLNEEDIENFSNLDGDNTNISNQDILKLYEKLQETCKNTPVTTGSIDSDTNAFTPSESLEHLQILKLLKDNIADNKKFQLQNELLQLINDNNNISSELKQEYNDATNKLKDTETALKTKQREYDEEKNKVLKIKEKISRKQGAIEGTKNETKQIQLQREIDGLKNELSIAEKSLIPVSNEIDKLNTSIKKYKSDLTEITKKIEKSDEKTAQKIKEKQSEIEKVDSQLASDLSDIDRQIEETQRLQLAQVQQAGSDSAHYEDITDGTVTDGTVGKNAAQALANATSQIGVREETGHNDGAQIAKYRNGVDNNAAWCASFVSWCYKGNDIFGYQASVSGIQMAAQKQNLYAEKGTYTPKPGDVMIQKNGASHTGIVESVDTDETIHTIEGNASNSVRRVTYKPGSKGYNHISGWVKMS